MFETENKSKFLSVVLFCSLEAFVLFHRELCVELSGYAAKISSICDPGLDPAVCKDHQTGLVWLSERWLRLQKCHRWCNTLSTGEYVLVHVPPGAVLFLFNGVCVTVADIYLLRLQDSVEHCIIGVTILSQLTNEINQVGCRPLFNSFLCQTGKNLT